MPSREIKWMKEKGPCKSTVEVQVPYFLYKKNVQEESFFVWRKRT